ncbi:ppGpp synthetase/RelA/SpoT-type nucleotidyltransferase [Breznakia sp. PF5-3]|uniref:GTP pyrophosphokinase n=1 Tax=unclassified Breznakia TaxID=2623764 RepID=UPI002404C7F3|nr:MULTISPECIES: RelA/spoT family protein [unclassified Breznakia]MDL2276467.1 RelA/spoT family protein [Breznakia sp. OttesenSCG-928-G09]MDF9823906.1 ppGpp synthetase/RelA/SpoT-type nucleotidyltransferase [Breznakia sp. PM6-1]MDF9834705.1 ppGpp synthetase/RelA/SpoT-type nucleotidyltransferase [Breznakia sp. PF5-3]MDF9836860.1 ppGpp synthetase/RelA/SpoT-type nucleotidyltransferase [Breznakia sp. PFB2-8]MDF9858877.1 ppGpp synthetase/RelA/SpoT-type nucleotidyltransferase [Breznakia sp. PH5-24]
MKLELFDKIDATITLLERNREEYQVIRKELKYTLLSILDREIAMDITTRIKESDSLKEKIIRNQYYLRYDTPEDILANLSDLIGLKIDCRFIDEEFKVYRELKEYFTIEKEDGFSTCEKFPHIALDMVPHQPQSQKNGFAIYRIDGYYDTGTHKVNFELQIKSLVNSFWGDIEHKLVYKNTNYMAYDYVMKDLLSSIKANLTIVDRQLHIIHDAMGSDYNVSTSFMNRISFEDLISKAINDLCAEKLRKAIGFSIDIRDTSNILGQYIFKKNIQHSKDDAQIVSLLQLFSRLNNEEIDFEHSIEMESCFVSEDPFHEVLGNYLLGKMNIDYEWFVFFRILFAIEPGNNAEDFKLFLNVLKSSFVKEETFENRFSKLSLEDAERTRSDCLELFAQGLCILNTIRIVHNSKMEDLNKCFSSFLDELEERVISYKDFEHYRDGYRDELHSMIKDIFS